MSTHSGRCAYAAGNDARTKILPCVGRLVGDRALAARNIRLVGDAALGAIEIDAYSWEDGLSARLPDGLFVSNGVELNWSTLWGQATLFRETDPRCCGTGGLASLRFEIQDDRLVLTDVDVVP